MKNQDILNFDQFLTKSMIMDSFHFFQYTHHMATFYGVYLYFCLELIVVWTRQDKSYVKFYKYIKKNYFWVNNILYTEAGPTLY